MKLLVLDGNSIVNRAFYGIKLLSTKEGIYTNAIYGFLTMLQRLKDETSPNAVAIAFDLKAPTFRHLAYDGYKATRKGMPNELAQQMPILKELLQDLGYTLVECSGFEADDILGTLAKECENTGDECVIATGDRDSLQLVSDKVTVRIATTKMGRPDVVLYNVDKVKEVYGVSPKQLIDIKAIQGDTSDNIPGVTGIGEVGAKKLIGEFGSVDYIYENIDSINIKEGMRLKLKNDKEKAYLSKMLGTISTQAPIDKNLNRFIVTSGNPNKAIATMKKLEFFNLIKKLDLKENSEQPTIQQEVAVVQEKKALKYEFVEDISDEIIQFVKAENKPCMCFATTEITKKNVQNYFYIVGKENVFEMDTEKSDLSKIFTLLDENKTLLTYNAKAIFSYCDKNSTSLKCKIFDSMLGAYILNPSSPDYSIDRLSDEYVLSQKLEVEDITNIGEKELPLRTKTINAVSVLGEICENIALKINSNGQDSLLNDIELPLSKVLAEMENVGFMVDKDGVEQYGTLLGFKIDVLQQEIYDSVGYEFNINSPKQLGEALFEKLQLPSGKKTKTGYSTGVEVLENLRNTHPCVEKILEYRKLTKLKSTYCDGLVKVVDKDGRIHTIFNQVETRTGRLSSTEPNLQNIPVKTDLGKELRRYFIAKDGWTLIDADYSQIELRVLSSSAKDENMIKAFNDNVDIHATTASQVFKMPLEMINSTLRSRAKAVNFGIVYGISSFSLAKDIGVSRKEADTYIKDYLNLYTGVANFMKQSIQRAKDLGYAETTFGRRRYLPELASSNFNLRSFGERVAMNMPIQGTAADIIKIAMIKVDERLKKENLQARLILQVHDELILESPIDEAVHASDILKEEMENAVNLAVKLTVDCNIGKTWYDAKG